MSTHIARSGNSGSAAKFLEPPSLNGRFPEVLHRACPGALGDAVKIGTKENRLQHVRVK
jgi:hypothetical protein